MTAEGNPKTSDAHPPNGPSSPELAITFDTDWSPEWIVREVLEQCLDADVKTTWFVTGPSESLLRAADEGLVELGLHPNFLPGSTHGLNPSEVFETVRQFAPLATAMRTHGLFQSSRLMRLAVEAGIEVDCSQLLPNHPGLRPNYLHWPDGRRLTRLPIFWEDDIELMAPEVVWPDLDDLLSVPGLKVLNFHPFHILLDTPDISYYESLKQREDMHSWSPEFVRSHRCDGDGLASLFRRLIRDHGSRSHYVTSLAVGCAL